MKWGVYMPDIKSILLLCSFLCFITGIFSPEVIIRWGIPSVKTRKRVLWTFGMMTLLLVGIRQLTEFTSVEDSATNHQGQGVNVETFVFSSPEEEQQKIYKLTSSVQNNQLEIKIVNQQMASDRAVEKAPEGYEFVQLDVNITNKMDEPSAINLADLQLQTETLEFLLPMKDHLPTQKLELLPQESKTVSLVYLQPTKQEQLMFSYLPTSSEEETPEEEEVSVSQIGDIVKAKQAMIQVHEVKREASKKEGYETLLISLSLKNSTDMTVNYYPFHFSLAADGLTQRVKPTIDMSEVKTLGISELVGGGMVSGTLIFEIPQGIQQLRLHYDEPSLFSTQPIEIDLTSTNQEVTPLQPEVKLNEQWQASDALNDHHLEVTKVEFVKETKYTKAKDHQQFIIIGVELSNQSTEKQDYTAFDFKLMNEQGRLILPNLLLIDNQSELTSGSLEPSESVQGYLLFEDTDLYTTYHLLYSPSHWKSGEGLIKELHPSGE